MLSSGARVAELKEMNSPSSRLYSNLYSLKVEPQKSSTLRLSLKPAESTGKMQGKRMRTAEEETEYSSRQSQIYFRNSNEGIESSTFPAFHKKMSNGQALPNMVFQEEMESSDSFHGLEFPSCREVSAREEVDHSISNEFVLGTHSIPTIATSPEMRSKKTSRQPSNTVTFANLLTPSPILSPRYSAEACKGKGLKSKMSDNRGVPVGSRMNSPKMCFSPVRQATPSTVDEKGSRANYNFFYAEEIAGKWPKSPRVSVLSVLDADNTSEEELRDVIYQEYINYRGADRNSSPFSSVEQSLKNLDDYKDKRSAFFQSVPQHSRELSEGLVLLKEMRSLQKRTNTIESMESSNS